MKAKDPFYTSSKWRRAREEILHRDNFICHLCKKPGADCVDHIVPRSKGGSWLDPENLAAAHVSCNSAKANKGRAIKPSREW